MKARIAKKYLKSLQHHALQPGDLLVFRVPSDTDIHQQASMQMALKQLFPENRVLIMPRDVALEVVSQDPRVKAHCEHCPGIDKPHGPHE